MGPPIRGLCSQTTTPSAKEIPTDCAKPEFQAFGSREAVGDFKGGGSVPKTAFRCCAKLAACFADYGSRRRVERQVQRLVGLGYEDLNDRDELREDSLPALAGDDLTGENRVRERARRRPLAGHPEPV